MPYSPEEIVADCNVIKAIWEETRGHLDNKAQVVTAYGVCRSLAKLIEIKVADLESLDGGPIWPGGTSSGYFLEKVSNAVGSFGRLAEKILAGKYGEGDVQDVISDFVKVPLSFPNYTAPYGPFLQSEK